MSIRRWAILLLATAFASRLAAQQAVPPHEAASPAPAYGSLSALMAALPDVSPPPFGEDRALWVGALPLSCLDQLQPTPSGSRASRTQSSRSRPGADYFWLPTYRLVPDYTHTRAFFGCSDWQSAVSSTWATVRLLERDPHDGLQDLAREKLAAHLGASNLAGELSFFRDAAGSFERPYGYAWLLKLQSQLLAWPDSQATRWAANVGPLASWMADSLASWAGKLKKPVRFGTEANTAFTLDLALDYADAANDGALRSALVEAARRFYAGDRSCALHAPAVQTDVGDSTAAPDSLQREHPGTPSGRARRARLDVLSPCLAEASLMARALDPDTFHGWIGTFLPALTSSAFAPLTKPLPEAAAGIERARLAGLSFQRAQAMARIAGALPPGDERGAVWRRLSAIQADAGFRMMRTDTSGTSWVPAWALRYIDERDSPTPSDWSLGAGAPAAGRRLGAASDTTADTLHVFPDLASFYASLPDVRPVRLGPENAIWLSTMPLSCEDHPHAHPKPPPYLWTVSYAPVPGYRTTRAFYGCSDWHSAVNSTWTLVKLLKLRPDLPTAPVIRQKLDAHLGKSNVLGDLAFFKTAGSFELPYGYAWLLRLEGELRSWNDPDAQRWAANLEPLASWMATRMIVYLDGLKKPVRVGWHPMTAMAMDNMLAYAEAHDPDLERSIRENAERFFAKDRHCDTASEPGPSDFASPCLMEATVMGRLMKRSAWLAWIDDFLPPIQSKAFRPETRPLGPDFVSNPRAIAARSHIIGLAFMRAKAMGELANRLRPDDPRVPVLRRLAAIQAGKGFKVIGAVGYMGSHYYATFATLYLLTTEGR